MISPMSGTFAASAASTHASCESASPTISNCRSTADRKTMSRSRSARALPAVITAMISAASRASHNSAFGSRFKDRLPGGLDARLEVRVADGTCFNEIDRTTEQLLQCFFEVEISAERHCPWIAAVELDQKIQIAARRIEIAAAGGRAEQVEPANMKAPAQCPQLGSAKR